MTMVNEDGDEMEVVRVDSNQVHRVSLATKDKIGFALAFAGLLLTVIITVVAGFWKYSLDMTKANGDLEALVQSTAKELKGEVNTIESKVDSVKSEVAELRTDVREIRTEARSRQ